MRSSSPTSSARTIRTTSGVSATCSRSPSARAVSSASEVDRYCAWPGQACGYKVGHSEINRLRERAKTALGPKFDLEAFDDTVVLGGNVPLDVLANNVDEYVRASTS